MSARAILVNRFQVAHFARGMRRHIHLFCFKGHFDRAGAKALGLGAWFGHLELRFQRFTHFFQLRPDIAELGFGLRPT